MKETQVGATDARKREAAMTEVKLTLAYVTNEDDDTVSVVDIVGRRSPSVRFFCEASLG
jgi:DNA-binding beta-propeller fold protein YncE